MLSYIRCCSLLTNRGSLNFQRFTFLQVPSFITIKLNQKHADQQNQDLSISSSENKEQLQEYLSQDIKASIMAYPYRFIPSSIIDNYASIDKDKELVKDIIAFRCLANINQSHLRQAFQILKPQTVTLKKVNVNQFGLGRQIFTDHFNSKAEELRKALNGTQNLEEKLKYLIVLNNYMLNNSTTELVKEINEKQLLEWDKTGLALAYYIQLLIKNNLPFKHLITKISEKLAQQTIPQSQKLKVANALISLPRFYKSFSTHFVDSLVAIIRREIPKMNNYQLLQVLRFIFEYTSDQSKKLCTSLLEFIASMNPALRPERAHDLMPMILKTFKYARALKINIEPTITTLIARAPEYQSILKNDSTIYFRTLILLWQAEEVNQTMLAKISVHITQGIKYYASTSVVVQSQEIKKMLELILKYWKQLRIEQRNVIKEEVINILLTLTSQISIIYQSLLVLLQQKDELLLTQKNKAIINQYVNIYFGRTCAKNNLGCWQVKNNFEENIFLANLIIKNNLTFIQSIPQIENVNYDQIKSMSLDSLDSLIQYLILHSALKPYQIYSTINKIEEKIIHYFNKKRVSFRTTLLLLQACSKANYERKHIYSRIEKAIFEILQKYPNFIIKKPDLHLIKDHMTKRNMGTRGLQEMINEAIDKPHNWKVVRKRYVDHQIQFWKKFDERQRRKTKQE